MHTFEMLKKYTTQELHHLFTESKPAHFDEVKEYAFIGYNTNSLTGILGFRNFIKVFEYSTEKGKWGYNIIVSQKKSSNFDTYIKRDKKGIPAQQGFYSVYENKKNETKGLVIDYGTGLNSFLEPARFLKDYLVVPSADNPNLFLGKAFLNLNGKLFFLSYFILERFKPLHQI